MFLKSLLFGVDFKLWVPAFKYENLYTQYKWYEKQDRNPDLSVINVCRYIG